MTGSGLSRSELRRRILEKRTEAEELRAKVSEARRTAQELRELLKASSVTDVSLIPSELQAGRKHAAKTESELQKLLQMLLENVDLSNQIIFECGEGPVGVAGRGIYLQRMAAWRVRAQTAPKLKLSVPFELQGEIQELLTAGRAAGRVPEEALQKFVRSWELVGAEVASGPPGQGRPEPAIFLLHRESAQAIVVAEWPAVDFPLLATCPCTAPPAHSPAVPASLHLQEPAQSSKKSSQTVRMKVAVGDRVEVEYQGRWYSGVLAGVQGHMVSVKCDVDPPDVITLAAFANVRPLHREQPLQHFRSPMTIAEGDRVEVEYQGQWFAGVLQSVQGGMANVKCDVDSPGVITIAPLTNVRPERPQDQSPGEKLQRHARARSVG